MKGSLRKISMGFTGFAALGLMLALASAGPRSPLDGKWRWSGTAGWQRIEFDLSSNGKTVKGSMKMGPGVSPSTKDAEDWEYFFEPAVFPILDGKVDGDTITFDQRVARGAGLKPDELLKYTGKIEGDRVTFVRDSFQRYDMELARLEHAPVEECKPGTAAVLPFQPDECPKDQFVLGNHKIEFVAVREGIAPASAMRSAGGRAPRKCSVLESGKPITIQEFEPPDAPANNWQGAGATGPPTDTFQEVLDPLFGLPDAAENQDFEKMVDAVAKSGSEVYFIAIHTNRDPEFGPALVGRRISGLFPGSNEAIDGYLAKVRAHMERLAAVSGGRVFYGDSPDDAVAIYSSLTQKLGIGAYALTIPAVASAEEASPIEVHVKDPNLHVSMLSAPGQARRP